MKKIYRLLFLCFISVFFATFSANAETKTYFKLPGGEIVVPYDEMFICDYSNMASSDSVGVAIGFKNNKQTFVEFYSGKNYDNGSVFFSAENGTVDITDENGYFFKDRYVTEHIVIRDNYLKIPYGLNTFNLAYEPGTIISQSNVGNNPNKDSFCPSYVYITEDERNDGEFTFKLSNKVMSETEKYRKTCTYDEKRYECLKDKNNVIISPKNIWMFELNNQPTNSELEYRKKYCNTGTCVVDASDNEIADSDVTIEEEETIDAEYATVTCQYETQFVANLKESNGNPEFSNGDGCVKDYFTIELFYDDSDRLNKVKINNGLGIGTFGENKSSFTYCKKSDVGCDLVNSKGLYHAGIVNLEDYLDKENPGKCVDTLYWSTHSDFSAYIFPTEKSMRTFFGFDCESGKNDLGVKFCELIGQNEDKVKTRIFSAVLTKMTTDNGVSQNYNNQSTCPIDQYDLPPDDVPDYHPKEYEIVFNCSSLGELADWLSWLFIGIQAGSIILTIALTSLDIIKAISSFDEKNYKKVWNHLVIRLIVVALLFLLKPLCLLLLNFFGIGGDIDFCI